MKTSEILEQFMSDAYARRMDLTGDKSRFFKLKTARAWTAWLTKARGAA